MEGDEVKRDLPKKELMCDARVDPYVSSCLWLCFHVFLPSPVGQRGMKVALGYQLLDFGILSLQNHTG